MKRFIIPILFLLVTLHCPGQNVSMLGAGLGRQLVLGNWESANGTYFVDFPTREAEIHWLFLPEDQSIIFRQSLGFNQNHLYKSEASRGQANTYNSIPYMWSYTDKYVKSQNLCLSSYVLASTKGREVKFFGGFGFNIQYSLHADYEVYQTRFWLHRDTSNVLVQDSTTYGLIQKKSYGPAFSFMRPGVQAGLLVHLTRKLYLEGFADAGASSAMRFKPMTDLHFVYFLTFNISVYYQPGKNPDAPTSGSPQ